MVIDTPDVAAADALVALWLDLAREQHTHGSELAAEANRGAVREAVVRGIVTGGVLVARIEDGSSAGETDIVGFVTFGPDTGRYERTVSRGTIRNLYVVPEHRNAEVGSALLEAAESALEESGVETIALDAMAENEGARRFYRRHGYTSHRVTLTKPVESDTH